MTDDWYTADTTPEKLKLPVPTNVTVIVETDIQGQVHRSSHPAVYRGGRRKNKWVLLEKHGMAWSLAENQRVTHWRLRT